MIAHILSTGDEVLLGDIVDTNSAYLCQNLKNMGLTVGKITTVGDDLNLIASEIETVSLSADICLVTGGLGPTQDDLTAAACSKAAKDKLMLNKAALASMAVYFKKRGFILTEDNKKQAILPSKSIMLKNCNGTAPGFYIKIHRCLFFFIPGVPAEMKAMFNKEVKPVLVSQFKLKNHILIERLTIFGLGESRVGVLLNGFRDKFPQMRLGFRANFPVVEVKIILSAAPKDEQKERSKLKAAKKWTVDQLENKVISDQGLSLEQVVGKLLTNQKKTLAVAESCTGGLISNMMTNVSGSSDYFLFSAVTYSNDAKINILGVQKKTILTHGAVHERTALEMAQGAKMKSGADFAISTTGIAGPTGGTREKPVGTVCIGIAGPGISAAKTYMFSFDDRLMNKTIFAMAALEQLRRHLVGLSKTP